MNKLAIVLGVIAISLVMFSYSAEAWSLWEFLGLAKADSDLIGYTIDGQTTHIWNNGTIKQDYYYTGNCNQQLSNIPDEQWERVTLGLTYGTTAEKLINNYIELHSGDCNLIEDSGEDYVNLTVWKPISYLGHTGILAKNSYIELNDNMITETFYFKSNDNINVDVWFILKRNNIDISLNGKEDYVEVIGLDGTVKHLNLTQANNLIIIRDNTEIYPELYLYDYETKENIAFIANTNADFKFITNNGNLYTAFNAKKFVPNQIKTLETYWVDADGIEETYNYEVKCSSNPAPPLGYEFESSISADSLGTARAKIIDIFLRSFDQILTIDEIIFMGVNQ